MLGEVVWAWAVVRGGGEEVVITTSTNYGNLLQSLRNNWLTVFVGQESTSRQINRIKVAQCD